MIWELYGTRMEGGNPDSLRRRSPQHRPVRPRFGRARFNGERLVVIALDEPEPGARTNSPRFQKFQQVPVALVDPADNIILPRLRFRQQHQPAPAPTGRAFQFAEIAMRTRPSAPQ